MVLELYVYSYGPRIIIKLEKYNSCTVLILKGHTFLQMLFLLSVVYSLCKYLNVVQIIDNFVVKISAISFQGKPRACVYEWVMLDIQIKSRL